MAITLRPLSLSDLEIWRAIVSHPSLATHFETLQGPTALESNLHDPYLNPALSWVAFLDDTPAGFCLTLSLPRWAVLRLGVVASARRRGLGTALLAAALERLPGGVGTCDVLALTGWVPNPEATTFAEHQGFRHDRFFWRMERTGGPAPEVGWPEGIEPRRFEGNDTALEDWNAAYNLSFATHYGFVELTVEACRAVITRPMVVPDGLLLAYRDGTCVGFCRTVLHNDFGEVASLGVVPAARGIGLGRALLRWGVAWLLDARAPRVTLMVDGQNETALSLYRAEAFEVVRTREVWVRSLS